VFTVDERWSDADIPVTIKLATGFDEKFKTIRRLMMLPPPAPAPRSVTTMTATRVLSSAQGYQNNASTSRLGNTISLSSSSQNLPKVKGVIQERNHARAHLQGGDRRITITVMLWEVGLAFSKKESAVNGTRVREAFLETDICRLAVKHLFDLIKDSLRSSIGMTSEFKFLGDHLNL